MAKTKKAENKAGIVVENKTIEAENKAVSMDNSKVMIRFTKSYSIYTKGDTTLRTLAQAERLEAEGFAEIIK